MPKKFKGECSKATVARARKEAVRQEEKDRVQKEIEDEYWRDDNKLNQNKVTRKDEKERKRLDLLERKKQNEALLQAESATMKSAKPVPVSKITRHQINATALKSNDNEPVSPNVTPAVCETPIEENINRIVYEGDSARTVHEAISVLTDSVVPVDKHPEKRMRAIYIEFEEEHLATLRIKFPDLRLSQLKHMVQKLWQKSPTNPMNKVVFGYNSRK